MKKTRKVTTEALALMVELLPTIGSLRDLSEITGVQLDAVRGAVAPFLAIMKLQGTHPQCGCGRDRFHPYGCADSHAKAKYHKGYVMLGRSHAEGAVLLARREAAVEMLATGARQKDVDEAFGMKKGGAKSYIRFLTPEQLAQRTAAMAEKSASRKPRNRASRAKKAAPPPVAPRPFKDALYARIAAAVPRWVTEATRDDIISEMYLAVQEGALSVDNIEANAKRFASQAVTLWENRFGPRSIDEPMFSDSNHTLADMLPDPRALAAFNHIMIGEFA